MAASLAHSNMKEHFCKNEKLAVMGCAPPGFLEQCLGLLLPDPPKSAVGGLGLAHTPNVLVCELSAKGSLKKQLLWCSQALH